ncbi:hypothetical protein [Pseudomonas sp. M47T1]|uniref:hypothetical protein n=1 Tax=Pseudomonas sp. M47T1 TaxID=1179778 RepID=UPI0005B82E03|nr:hypothetical protein [Pseudomonas sp. M47T1]
MSKISIAAANSTSDIEAAKFLHRRLKMSLIGSQKKLAMGDKGLFYTCELFGNDHVEREKEIRDIVNFFRSRKVPLIYIEISSNQNWGDIKAEDLRKYYVEESSVLNVLDENHGFFE